MSENSTGDKPKKKKREFGRRRYLRNFVRNSAGEYVYMGEHVHWSKGRKTQLFWMWCLTVFEVVLTVICGCMPMAGMEQRFYVLIPYLFVFLSVFIQLWKLIDLSFAGTDIRDYIFSRTVPVLTVTPWITLGTGIATFVAEIIRCAQKDFVNYGWMAAFLALIAVVCACAALFHTLTKTYEIFHKK